VRSREGESARPCTLLSASGGSGLSPHKIFKIDVRQKAIFGPFLCLCEHLKLKYAIQYMVALNLGPTTTGHPLVKSWVSGHHGTPGSRPMIVLGAS